MSIAKYNLGPALDARTIPDNPWIGMMGIDAVQVLAALTRGRDPIRFDFTMHQQLQAGAHVPDRQIIVTGGLADMICRLCAAVVGAGIFTKFGNPEVNWKPNRESSDTARNLLAGSPFLWIDAYVPWRADPEREQLFFFLLTQVHRFVVLHEAAHILHDHQTHRGGRAMHVDGINSFDRAEDKAATEQARELVADAQAFHWHFELLETAFRFASEQPMHKLLRDKLVGSTRERLRMTLLAAFMVFQLLDRPGWTFESVRHASHPPAPFRVKAIFATALNLLHPDLGSKVLAEEVEFARTFGSMVVDIALDRLPTLNWLRTVEGSELDDWFGRIYPLMQDWSDPEFMGPPRSKPPFRLT